ncbi:MAG: hypothetical protein PWR10_625 [Halanaerobiales bacterium]|nr:hypothetical protein [Halanaerobiales bacterium]
MKKYLIIFLLLVIFAVGVWLLNIFGVISVRAWGEKVITSTPFLKDYVQTEEAFNQLLEKFKESENRLKEVSTKKEELQQSLAAARRQVDEYTKKVEKLEKELALLKKERLDEQERLDKLVKIYSKMKPEDAARIFSSLDEDMVLDLLINLKEEQAAAILSALPPEDAARYSNALNQ